MNYSDESHSGGNLWAWPSVGMGSLHVLDDLSYCQGHNSHGPDRHILGGGKELGGKVNVVIGEEMEAVTHTVDGDTNEG